MRNDGEGDSRYFGIGQCLTQVASKKELPVRWSGNWVTIIRMNQKPFPKPPPADPLPLEVWLDRTDRAEVGREPFFRGRDREFDVFRKAANSLHAGQTGGSTMIFQGAPGAGKSALMGECMEAVRRHSTPEAPWVAVSIYPDSLQSPVDVIEAMVDAANTESERLREITAGSVGAKALDEFLDLGRSLYRELSQRGGGAFGLSVGSRRDEGVTAGRVFRNAAPLLKNFRIVVFVDEAQNTPAKDTTRDVLDCLHRASHGIPLVAAFFGLSDTQDVLRQCGLSRFADGRIVNLETLVYEDTACAIHDALAAYDFTGTPEDRTVWVERLTELSQGWPQHINRVSVAAARVILEQGGRIEGRLLEQTLQRGQERKDDYYAGRLAAGSARAWVYRQLALAAEERDGVLSYDRIDRLTEGARNRTGETVDQFLTDALHAGLLAPANNLPDHYNIPIPSLADYLRALPAPSSLPP